MNNKVVETPVAEQSGGYQNKSDDGRGMGVYREIRWPLRHLVLAGLHWPSMSQGSGRADTGTASALRHRPVVMIHGWLDNSLTFAKLAPELARTTDVYAIDLAGHGHSDHRPLSQSYLLVDYIADLAELLDTHFDGPVDLVAHSLGGIVAIIYAAAFPEKVRKLAIIDSLGPISRPPDQVVGQLRNALLKRRNGSGTTPVYASVEDAAKARAGGLSPLSDEAAHVLVPRNLRQVEGGYCWRTDPRLRHPSMMQFDEEQVVAALREVTTETLLVRAEKGLLAHRDGFERRIAAVKPLTVVTVPGNHHCHLDGDVTPVVDAIREFLEGERS